MCKRIIPVQANIKVEHEYKFSSYSEIGMWGRFICGDLVDGRGFFSSYIQIFFTTKCKGFSRDYVDLTYS